MPQEFLHQSSRRRCSQRQSLVIHVDDLSSSLFILTRKPELSRFHNTSKPKSQFFHTRATHKQTELLIVVHHILKRSCVSRVQSVRTKPVPLSAASFRAVEEFLTIASSADLHPGLLVQNVSTSAPQLCTHQLPAELSPSYIHVWQWLQGIFRQTQFHEATVCLAPPTFQHVWWAAHL